MKKQKIDRKDAELLLRLMRENNFPQVWVPGPENRDLRQLLWHRHWMVQGPSSLTATGWARMQEHERDQALG